MTRDPYLHLYVPRRSERPSRWVTVRGFVAEFVVFVGGLLLILGVGVAASLR